MSECSVGFSISSEWKLRYMHDMAGQPIASGGYVGGGSEGINVQRIGAEIDERLPQTSIRAICYYHIVYAQ